MSHLTSSALVDGVTGPGKVAVSVRGPPASDSTWPLSSFPRASTRLMCVFFFVIYDFVHRLWLWWTGIDAHSVHQAQPPQIHSPDDPHQGLGPGLLPLLRGRLKLHQGLQGRGHALGEAPRQLALAPLLFARPLPLPRRGLLCLVQPAEGVEPVEENLAGCLLRLDRRLGGAVLGVWEEEGVGDRTDV